MRKLQISFIRLSAIWLALLCVWSLPHSYGQTILIEELTDIHLGEVTPTIGNLEANITLCVALNQNVRYQILASGDGMNGSFAMNSGPYFIPYSLQFTDRRRPRGYRDLLAGVPLFGLRARPNFNGTCRRSNANLRVRVDANDLRQAAGGEYFGTLFLTVSPE